MLMRRIFLIFYCLFIDNAILSRLIDNDSPLIDNAVLKSEINGLVVRFEKDLCIFIFINVNRFIVDIFI